MTGKLVLTLPKEGKVVVAHPRDERHAIGKARREGCPYMLRRFIELGNPCLIDLDAMPKVGEFWL